MSATPSPVIPRQVLFSDPDRGQVKWCPQGQYISYLSNYNNNLNLWVSSIEQPEVKKLISTSEHPIRDYWWTPDGEWLIYTHDCYGDENWQLYAYHLLTQETRSYTEPGCQTRLLQMSRQHPEQIVIALNLRDKRYHDVFLLNIKTGEKQCIFENNLYWDVIVDHDYQCRVGIKIHANGGEYIDLTTQESMTTIPTHDLFGLYFYPRLRSVFSHDNKILYIVHSHDSNTAMLVAMDMDKKTYTILAHRTEADISDVLYDPKTGEPLAYAVTDAKKQWFALEKNMQTMFSDLYGNVSQEESEVEIDIVSRQAATDQWIISAAYSDKPTSFYCYEAAEKKWTFLFLSHTALASYSFNPMQSFNITVRDGVRCRSYLSLPADCKGPVSLVLLVHGGPNYRDFWGWNAFHQWLSNRGYGVLSVNYRGSTGFGRQHSEAGNAEWAGKIREDLLDAVEWAIQEGITTEDQVAIMGRSFGGYQALLGLTMTPTRYCCGVDIVGPANLETMLQCFPPYWESMRGILHAMVGADPNTTQGKDFLRQQSPLTYADRIQRPLLIGHGMNDPRVQLSESDQMVAAMRRNHVPVRYVVFSNEGHQLSHIENRMAFYAMIEAFLAESLQAVKKEPCHEVIPETMACVN